VCEEDAYFQELVRYIHLNPLRAKIVKDLSSLDRYSWCGHSVLLIREVSEKEGINLKEMQSGSRRGKIPKIRSDLVYQLITEYGMTLAEMGRQLGVSTSAISKILKRRGEGLSI